MKQFLLFFLSIIFFISCTSTSSQQISFYNGLQLSLLPNEKEVNINHYPDVQSRYAEYFKSTNLSIPLTKYLKHPKYSLYIGIPYDVSMSVLTNQELYQQIEILEKQSKEGVYTFKRYKNDTGLFVMEYARKHNNNSIFLLGITSDSEASEKFLSWEVISEKLKPIN